MNILRKTSIIIFSVIIASIPLLFETNCTINNPIESLKVKIDFSPVSTVISGQFINIKTEATISQKNIKVTIQTDSANVIVDLLGEPKTEFSIDDGFLTFGISEGVIPSKEAAINMTLMISTEGYISTSKTLLITDTKNINFTIKMVELIATPAGVIAKIDNNGQTDSTGVLLADLIVQTDNEPETGTAAGISIEKGTIIKDENGNPLLGTLTTSVIYYNNQSDESLESFPGGLNVVIEKDSVGEQSEGIFVSAGFIAVEIIDEAGNKAASFDPAIKISLEIPPNTINPKTKQYIQNGDNVPIWSYDSKTGKWTFEYLGTVGSSSSLMRGNGNFSITFPANHLSYWNMDWHIPGKCNSGIITVAGNPDQLHLDIKIKRQQGGGYMFRWNPDPSDPNHITILGAPPDFPVTIEAYYLGSEVGSLDIDNLCQYTGTLNVELPQAKPKIDLDVKINAYCENYPNLEIKPTMPIYLRKLPAEQYRYCGYMDLGHIKIPGVEIGAEYQFKGVYEGKSADTTLTITEDLQNLDINFKIPKSICSDNAGD